MAHVSIYCSSQPPCLIWSLCLPGMMLPRDQIPDSWHPGSLAASSQAREEGNFLLAPPMLPWKQDGGAVLNHITPVPN